MGCSPNADRDTYLNIRGRTGCKRSGVRYLIWESRKKADSLRGHIAPSPSRLIYQGVEEDAVFLQRTASNFMQKLSQHDAAAKILVILEKHLSQFPPEERDRRVAAGRKRVKEILKKQKKEKLS